MSRGSINRPARTRNRETFGASRFFNSLAKELPRPAESSMAEAQRFLLRELANNPRPSIRPSKGQGKGTEAPSILFRQAIEKGKSEGHTEATIVWAFARLGEKGLWLDSSRFEQAVDDDATDFERLFDGPSWQVERRIYWDRQAFAKIVAEIEKPNDSGTKPAPYEFLLSYDHLSDAVKLTIGALRQIVDFEGDSSRRTLWVAMRDLDHLLNPLRLPLSDVRCEEMNPEPIQTANNQLAHSAIERLRACFVLLADSTGWQSAIGGVWGDETMPLGSDASEKIKRLLPLIEKAGEQFEQAIKTPGLVYLEPTASEPSDAKEEEPPGNEDAELVKPKPGYLGLILDKTYRTVSRKCRPHVKAVEIRSAIHWDIVLALVKNRGGWTKTSELADRGEDEPIQDTSVATHISKVREFLRPFGIEIDNSRTVGYRLIEISSK